MAAITALLLLLGMQEPRLTLEFRNENVDQVLRVIQTYAGAKVELAPEYRGQPVTFQAKNLTVTEALETIATSLGGASKKLGADRYRIAPKWRHALLARLGKKQAGELLVENAELRQALRLFEAQCGVRVHVDATVDRSRKIRFKAAGKSWSAALDEIAKAAGAGWDLRYGVAYLATAEQLERLPVRPPKIRDPAGIPLLLEDKSIEQALVYLQAASRRKFKWPQKLPANRVHATVKEVTLGQALALVLYPAGLTAELKEEVVVVTTRK